ncbi:MAG: hypothetical protein IJ580_03070 [Prevotella sp.]|nr:hypothetical protein [Prevotella sp.]
MNLTEKKRGGCLKYGLICAAVFVLIAVLGALFDTDEPSKDAGAKQEDTFMAYLDSLPDRVINRDSILQVMKRDYTFERDEFSNSGIVWVKPKSIPKSRNRNGVYCYFSLTDSVPSNFRFVLQYAGEQWLMLNDCTFNLDGVNWTYRPLKVERDHDSRIWEWFDDAVDMNISMFLYNVGQSKQVKVKLNGQKYYDTYTLKASETASIRQTLEHYEALGGKHPSTSAQRPIAFRKP